MGPRQRGWEGEQPQARAQVGLPGAGRGRNRFFPETSEDALPSHPLEVGSCPQELWRDTFLSLKPLTLWKFVTTVAGN